MYTVSIVTRAVLGAIFLIHVSIDLIYAQEDDAPISSIIWVIWMIYANLGIISFKLQDLNNNTEPNLGVKIFRSKTSFKALYHQLNIRHVSTWYPHSMETEPGEIFICPERNGGYIGQIVSKQVPQQVYSKYGHNFQHLDDMDRYVHYHRNQVYKYLFTDDFTLKLNFWPSSHCEWIFISSVLGSRYIYQRQSITSGLLNTCTCWRTNFSIHYSVILPLVPTQEFGINFSGVCLSSIFSKCFFLDYLQGILQILFFS